MIASLTIDAKYLPDWYDDRFGANIPLPDDPIRPLDGHVLAWARHAEEEIPLLAVKAGKVTTQYDWANWRAHILEERYRRLTKPLYLHLPFHYHRVPGRLRELAARAVLGTWAASALPRTRFPGFPVEQGFELLNHLFDCLRTPGDEGSQRQSEIILTHDIDTAAGFAAVRRTARLEMAYGFRSLWNVVACGYRIDHATLGWLIENGFQIGLHGYNHDNRLVFLSEEMMRRRLDRCAEIMVRYRITAFRSPCWFRTPTLFRVLRDYVKEDYSSLDTDMSCPGGRGGCLWTKRFSLNGLIHVPTTIPFEEATFFGIVPEKWTAFWRPKIHWLRGCGGDIVVNTHPDPHRSGNERALSAYEELLCELSDHRVTKTTEHRVEKPKSLVMTRNSAPVGARA